MRSDSASPSGSALYRALIVKVFDRDILPLRYRVGLSNQKMYLNELMIMFYRSRRKKSFYCHSSDFRNMFRSFLTQVRSSSSLDLDGVCVSSRSRFGALYSFFNAELNEWHLQHKQKTLFHFFNPGVIFAPRTHPVKVNVDSWLPLSLKGDLCIELSGCTDSRWSIPYLRNNGGFLVSCSDKLNRTFNQFVNGCDEWNTDLVSTHPFPSLRIFHSHLASPLLTLPEGSVRRVFIHHVSEKILSALFLKKIEKLLESCDSEIFVVCKESCKNEISRKFAFFNVSVYWVASVPISLAHIYPNGLPHSEGGDSPVLAIFNRKPKNWPNYLFKGKTFF